MGIDLHESHKSIQSEINWFSKLQIPHTILDGVIWYLDENMVQPYVPFYKQLLVDQDKLNHLIRHFDAGLVRWTSKLQKNSLEKHHWHVVVKQFQANLGDLPAVTRKNLETGRRFCTCQRIDPTYLVNHEHLLHSKTMADILESKSSLGFDTENGLQKFLQLEQDFCDIIHYFGVFYESRLVGFTRCVVMSSCEVHISVMKLDLAFELYKIMETLTWEILQYYIEEHGFTQVISGTRPQDPASNDQDVFIEKMGFQKLPLQLNVHFKNRLHSQISFMQPMKKIMTSFGPPLKTRNFLLKDF